MNQVENRKYNNRRKRCFRQIIKQWRHVQNRYKHEQSGKNHRQLCFGTGCIIHRSSGNRSGNRNRSDDKTCYICKTETSQLSVGAEAFLFSIGERLRNRERVKERKKRNDEGQWHTRDRRVPSGSGQWAMRESPWDPAENRYSFLIQLEKMN